MIPRVFPLAILFSVTTTFSAGAHDALGDSGPFVNGLLHPLIVPAHILTLIAFGLWLGRQSNDAIRRAVIAFAVALIAGLIAGPLGAVPPAVPLGVALLGGGLAAWGVQASARVAAMIAVFVAALIGFDSAEEDVASAIGIWAGAHLIVLNVIGLSMRANAPWLIVATRIAGAWIGAIALMLLALNLRG
jgi:urease accessory protein